MTTDPGSDRASCGAPRRFAWKLLDPAGCTYYRGAACPYAMPGPNEKWGPWTEHPFPGTANGSGCGSGAYHFMLRPEWTYAPPRAWPWLAEVEGILGQSSEKLRAVRYRLRRVLPMQLWRWMRRRGMTGANLVDANLIGARLTDANLVDANLAGAWLVDANLIDANLARANLARANLTRAWLTRANLARAWLTDANLIGALPIDANLTGATLTGANLTRASLIGANLTGANLAGAILAGADLTGAILAGADLTGAILDRAILAGAMK